MARFRNVGTPSEEGVSGNFFSRRVVRVGLIATTALVLGVGGCLVINRGGQSETEDQSPAVPTAAVATTTEAVLGMGTPQALAAVEGVRLEGITFDAPMIQAVCIPGQKVIVNPQATEGASLRDKASTSGALLYVYKPEDGKEFTTKVCVDGEPVIVQGNPVQEWAAIEGVDNEGNPISAHVSAALLYTERPTDQ